MRTNTNKLTFTPIRSGPPGESTQEEWDPDTGD